MEYRVWIVVADMPFRDEAKWLPLVERLERERPEFGPVASWDDEATMVLTLAHDEPDRAAAAESATRVVGEALRATALADHFPVVFRVEPAADLIAA
ncbi:MAG TPA: hypothetical protein VES97_13135 [Solirubrobacteraceae bacterium]|nr:hypothetical protein [Solirubrobacteraceae bacterium]